MSEEPGWLSGRRADGDEDIEQGRSVFEADRRVAS